jgi:hypothetical protein
VLKEWVEAPSFDCLCVGNSACRLGDSCIGTGANRARILRQWRDGRVDSPFLLLARRGVSFERLAIFANAAFNDLGYPMLSTLLSWGRATLGAIPS